MDMNNKLCGAFLLAVAVLHCVLGDYELEVRLHEYNNPTSRYGGCGSDNVNGTERIRCCDHDDPVDVCEGGHRCDNYFVHCFREIGSNGSCISNEFNSSIFFDTNSVQFPSDESSINVPMAGAWQGIQLYTVVLDDDAGSFQQIDKFTIDLNTSFIIPGAGFTARTVYNGTFDLGHLELSFRVSCVKNFTGTFCENQLPPEADSPGNTNAIIGGAVGAVIVAITLVLIIALVLVIVAKTKIKSRKINGSSKRVPPRDSPTYETSWNPIKPETHNSSVATATTSTAPPNGTSVDKPEREFNNPIYGTPGFDTGDNEDRVYAQPVRTM